MNELGARQDKSHRNDLFLQGADPSKKQIHGAIFPFEAAPSPATIGNGTTDLGREKERKTVA
jgi:hypothetical protein